MDSYPFVGQNIIRPEPRFAGPAQPQPISHQFHHIHHIQNSLQYQQSSNMSNAIATGRVVVDREYHVDRQTFRTQGSLGLVPMVGPHSDFTKGDGVSLPPPLHVAQGRRRPKKLPKHCGVCGDRAKSFHFGGLSCDSCKAFFRRSVQNDAHLSYRCVYDSCCEIDMSSRKCCQFCRFQKCLTIGMEKSWVMTDQERRHLNQQRLQKKQNQTTLTRKQLEPSFKSSGSTNRTATEEPRNAFQCLTERAAAVASNDPAVIATHESEYVPDVHEMLNYMTYEEQLEIKSVVETYHHAYKKMPFRISLGEDRRDTLEIIEMFTTVLRRFAYFSKLNPDFAELSRNDQTNLLRTAALEMCLLRGAACFDTDKQRWPASSMELLKDCPQLRVEDIKHLVTKELFEMHITFMLDMQKLRVDEPIAMLLIMIILFSTERVHVESKIKINQSQEKFLMLLKKYVEWKFGKKARSIVYPQLLTKLADLRQVNDVHTDFNLNVDKEDMNMIKKSLMELDLNSAPNWKMIPETRLNPESEKCRVATPNLPAPLPAVESKSACGPMATSTLIQGFADRRIPALLDNPHAVFKPDLGMIQHVKQTLGSLFPITGLSPAFTSNTQYIPPGHVSTDSTSQKPAFLSDSQATIIRRHSTSGFSVAPSSDFEGGTAWFGGEVKSFADDLT